MSEARNELGRGLAARPRPKRLAVVVACFLVATLVFVFRAYQLQVALADVHLEQLDWRPEFWRAQRTARGSIEDRNGRVLATDEELRDVFIDARYLFTQQPELAPVVRAELVRWAEEEGGFADFDLATFDAWAADPEPASLPAFVRLVRDLRPDAAQRMLRSLRAEGVNALGADTTHRRNYPMGSLAAPLVGFVNREHVGGAGIEASHHQTLRGDTVDVPYRRNEFGVSIVEGHMPDLDAARGHDVRLTIDARIQAVAERALAESLETFDASAGVVVASCPDTGEILAMASLPGNDPVDFNEGDPAAWQHRAIAHVYEPGSTAKVFAFAAALDAGVIRYDTRFDCNDGYYSVGGRRKFDRYCREDDIEAWDAIRVSSNIGAIGMASRMSDDVYAGTLRRFGFGERFGVGLSGESAGLFPALPWRESTQQTISYGYGISVTPLQMNVATAAIANGGLRMEPCLVAEVRDGHGELVLANQPREVEQVVSLRTASQVTRAMESVTQEGGTGTATAIEGVRVAGKTGTAHLLHPDGGYIEDEFLSAFTGFAPAEDPIIAVTVFVEGPERELGYYGGTVAGPVFRAVVVEALTLDGMLPSFDGDEDEAPVVESRDDRETPRCELHAASDGLPDARACWPSDALRRFARLDIDVHVEGTGRVVRQRPAPGTALDEVDSVTLVLETAGAP